VGSLGRFGLVGLGRAGLAPVGPVLFEATPRTRSATLFGAAVLRGGWGFVRGVAFDRNDAGRVFIDGHFGGLSGVAAARVT
jgi:hypothetical protein